MKWYVSQNGKAAGPLSEQRVAMLVSWGRISRAAYICDEQSSCWLPITHSRFGSLLAASSGATLPGGEPSLAFSSSCTGGSPSRSGAARAGRSLHPGVAFALLILLSTTAFLMSLRFSPASGAHGPSAPRSVTAGRWSSPAR